MTYMLYTKILRPLLFNYTDPEDIHHAVIHQLGFWSKIKPINWMAKKICAVTDQSLRVKLGNIELPNPVGLAAGFDKYIDAPFSYPMLGFGWAELGSITYSEQAGNPRPRLWRVPDDQGLIVYYGLANAGAVKTAEVLKKKLAHAHPIPFGISIAPSNNLDLSQMANDYIKTLLLVHPYADYITLNVSCPNVAAKDIFSQVSFIVELMRTARQTMDLNNIHKDIFIKIGPGHSTEDLQHIAQSAIENKLTGIIATNLIKNRSLATFKSSPEALNHPGGISGARLQGLSDSTIQTLYKAVRGKVHIIGVGGIFTAADAYARIRSGASALQLVTGFVYGGPLAIRKINVGLAKLLKQDGFKSVSEAVGADVHTHV